MIFYGYFKRKSLHFVSETKLQKNQARTKPPSSPKFDKVKTKWKAFWQNVSHFYFQKQDLLDWLILTDLRIGFELMLLDLKK